MVAKPQTALVAWPDEVEKFFYGKSEERAERQRMAINDQQRSARFVGYGINHRFGIGMRFSDRRAPAWDRRTSR